MPRTFRSEIKGKVESLRTYFFGRSEHLIPTTDDAYSIGMYNRRWLGHYIVNPAQMLSAVLMPNRFSGGRLMYAFLAQSYETFGQTKNAVHNWTWSNVGADDYFATAYGGPYIDLNGTDEYLYMDDHTSQEVGSEEFFAWHWFYPTSLAANDTIAGKWDAGNNNREWYLTHAATTGTISCGVSVDGTATTASRASTLDTSGLNVWYFAAFYYQPSTLLRIFVAPSTSTALTIDSNTTSIPASLHDSTAALAIATVYNSGSATSVGEGHYGIGAAWLNVQASGVNNFANEIFQTTRWFYR